MASSAINRCFCFHGKAHFGRRGHLLAPPRPARPARALYRSARESPPTPRPARPRPSATLASRPGAGPTMRRARPAIPQAVERVPAGRGREADDAATATSPSICAHKACRSWPLVQAGLYSGLQLLLLGEEAGALGTCLQVLLDFKAGLWRPTRSQGKGLAVFGLRRISYSILLQ